MSKRAAVYARRSTEQNVAAEAKSVTRQVENARAFALTRGWTVADDAVFADDGISGAEFAKRPGLQRLLALARQRAFEMLVVSEQKSIGRESVETQFTIKQLAEFGVEVFEYVHGRSLTPKTWMDKVMSAVQSGADDAHREQTAERMHEAHRRLASKGYVTGGRLFGYRNVDVTKGLDQHGRPLRSHVERAIEPAEAAVVLRIFEMYASGLGLKSIAKRLTADRAPSPRYSRQPADATGGNPVADRPPHDGWAPATVGAVLKREVYHGVAVWNMCRKRNDWGKVDVRPRPEAEWQRTPVEHLRIVPEELWRRVASRREDVEGRALRFGSGRLSGRPSPKVQNLLAGLATCGVCGGGLIVVESGGPRTDAFDAKHLPSPGTPLPAAPRGRYRYYACSRRKHSGTCTNALRVRVEEVDEAVLAAIEEHALTPEAVEQVVRLSERDDVADRRAGLEKEAAEVRRKLARQVEAIEAAGEVASLVERIKVLEGRLKEIARELADLRPVPRLAPAVVEGRLAEWRRLLRQSPTQGRAVLQRVLRGRITFVPEGRGYDFSAPTRFDKLFAGVVAPLPAFVKAGDTTGAGHIRPEDTMDADYGRLLEAAERGAKGWRPWRDSNPRSSP
jgi:site-specific DNA recombinase